MDSILLVKQTRFLPWISFFPRSQSWRGFKKFNSQLKTKELLGPQSSTYTQTCHLSTCARESPIGNLNQSSWAFMTLFRQDSQYSSTACTEAHAIDVRIQQGSGSDIHVNAQIRGSTQTTKNAWISSGDCSYMATKKAKDVILCHYARSKRKKMHNF